ncbi:ribonuclease HI family protein [Candidatus Peregrinibacteria bacterium]|nr:ribonuclease HI family protein [Candidatus Peregrinibacteria bacterium]
MKISDKHIKAIEELIPKKDQQKFVDNAIEKELKKYKIENSEIFEVYCDGGSRGNPGAAGGGFGLYRGGKLVLKGSEFFGERTNNQAEYLSLRLALRETYSKFGDVKLHCFMDSEFVVKQMKGEYKVKNANIKPLYDEVRQITEQFSSFKISHVRREQNQLADMMANEAMDRRA